MHIRTFFTSLPIRKKLLLLLLLAFLPIAGIITASGLHFRNHVVNDAKNNALLLVQSLAAQQEEIAAGTEMLLGTLAQLSEVQKLDAEACNKLFRELIKRYPCYSTIAAATPDGNMFAASSPFQPGTVNLADRKHIKDAIRTGDFSAGEYIVGRVSKTQSINYTYPVFDAHKNLIAIAIAGFKLDGYNRYITNANLSEDTAVVITDYAGVHLFRLPVSDSAALDTPIPEDSFKWVSGDLDHGLFERIGQDGISRIYAFRQLRLKESSPPYLFMLVGIPKDKILHHANLTMLSNLLILGTISLIVMSLAWVLGEFIVIKPINRLVTVTQRLGNGELSIRTSQPHTSDELGNLAKSFDDLALTLEMRDIERGKAEEALQQSETRYRLLAENATDVIWTIDMDMRLTYVSPSVTRLLNITAEEAMARTMQQAFTPAAFEKAMQLFAEEMAIESTGHADPDRSRMLELEMVRKDENAVPVEGNFTFLRDPKGKVIGILAIVRDITERKRIEAEKVGIEAQSRQLQKAESLGRMAGAIAHHFNNQLQIVMGSLEMAMDDTCQVLDASELLAEAMQAARKAAEVSGMMLTYLGQTSDKHEPTDLSKACRQSLTLLQAAAPKGMILKADFPSSGPVIRANAGQIQQVLTNLVTNAWEASGEKKGAIGLTVKTVSHADISALKRFPIDWQPEDIVYACLEVMDEGHGIPDGDIEKLFDPFFTTKFTGRGLGLPLVMGIVKAHGGGITVESEPGQGSVFRVFLPVLTEEVPFQPDLPAMPEAIQTVKAEKFAKIEGGGTMLLIEDEEQVRNMARIMLTRLGYTVLEAKDGVDAVEVFKHHQDEIRCVLSDLTMPRMNGWDTLTALRKISPDIPVILSSGYDEAQVMAGEHFERPNAFLGKPYQLKGLRETISRVLTAPAGDNGQLKTTN